MTSRWGSTAAVQNYLLHWHEVHGGAIGEGISRTSDPNAAMFHIVVEYNGTPPMREWLRATSGDEALKFAKNRYPTAKQITLLTKTNEQRPS